MKIRNCEVMLNPWTACAVMAALPCRGEVSSLDAVLSPPKIAQLVADE